MNNRVRVKICGLTEPAHAETCEQVGAEFLGLVFAERSRRRLTVEQARRVTAALSPRVAPCVTTLPLGEGGGWFDRCAAALDQLRGPRPLVVGVFADQPVTLVNSIAEACDLDLVQLSGDESWEQCLAIKRPVIKSLRVPGESPTVQALLALAEFGTASLCMLDADVPGELGGTGTLADWEAAAQIARSLPLMLAGGLSPENVGEAVARVSPWAVDVSSGVERDGGKDVERIAAFVRAVKRAAVGVAR